MLTNELLDQGFIQHNSDLYASPVLLMGKQDSTWQLCVYYKQLNNQIEKDRHPIPLIDDLLDELEGFIIYSNMDLRAGYGYHQLRLKEGEDFKTTFRTHFEHLEYLVMPFGLTNSLADFML